MKTRSCCSRLFTRPNARRVLSPALLLALVSPARAPAQGAAPEVSLPNTALHTVHAAATQRDYRIYVAWPAGYTSGDTTRYPVLYLLDGDGSFALVTQAYRGLRLGKGVREAILVGIGYPTDSIFETLARRTLDMTPTRDTALERQFSAAYGQAVKTGGAGAFLNALKADIIPFIEHRYRASSERLFAGYSFGGLFGAFVLFHEPELFGGYMLGSPSFWWDGGVTFRDEKLYAAGHRALPAQLFLSVGSREGKTMVPPLHEMAAVLTARKYAGLQLTTVEFADETHLSGIPAALSRGLTVLLSPAPKR